MKVLRNTSGEVWLGMAVPETGDSTKPEAMRDFCGAVVGTTPVSLTLKVLLLKAGNEEMLHRMRLLLPVRVLWVAVVPVTGVSVTLCKVVGQKTSPCTLKLLCAAFVLLRTVYTKVTLLLRPSALMLGLI